MKLEYLKPGPEYEAEALRFRDAFYAAGEREINGSGGLDFFPDFSVWLHSVDAGECDCGTGPLPSQRIRLVRDADTGEVVGIVDIRPVLPGDKEHFGHLGYAVLPGHRRRGLATEIVRWGIQTLRAAGVGDILASVYEENAASRRVLEKCGFLQKGSWREGGTGKTVLQYVNTGG